MAEASLTPEAALERFVVENDDLLDLEARIGRFNIFDALGIARAEIRHSNFLRFLLDPNESHGQGDVFLRAVLMDLLKSAPPELRPLSPIEVDGAELRGVEVFRERDRIDLEIVCREPAFVIAIENKVDAGEHGDQLKRYGKSIKRRHGDTRAMFVFLTPAGEDASDPMWVTYSYRLLHHTLTRVRASHHSSIGDDVLAFLDHYLSLIGTRFMNDVKIDELCERIYRNHRQALELIIERVGRLSHGPVALVHSIVSADERWNVFPQSGRNVDFVPRAWMTWMPKQSANRDQDPASWFVIRFQVVGNRLDHYIEVRRMRDLALRTRIVKRLLARGAELGFKRPSNRKMTDAYTRVSGREHLLRWTDEEPPSEESLREVINAKIETLWPAIAAIGESIKEGIDSKTA